MFQIKWNNNRSAGIPSLIKEIALFVVTSLGTGVAGALVISMMTLLLAQAAGAVG